MKPIVFAKPYLKRHIHGKKGDEFIFLVQIAFVSV